jgi:hypothetical protein
MTATQTQAGLLYPIICRRSGGHHRRSSILELKVTIHVKALVKEQLQLLLLLVPVVQGTLLGL